MIRVNLDGFFGNLDDGNDGNSAGLGHLYLVTNLDIRQFFREFSTVYFYYKLILMGTVCLFRRYGNRLGFKPL